MSTDTSDRRQFLVPTLRGIIVRDETDKVVVQATPQQIQQFAPRPGQEVAVRPETPPVRMRVGGRRYAARSANMYTYGPASAWQEPTLEEDARPEVGRLRYDDYLYDRDGRPVAQIVAVDVYQDRFETTTFGDAVRSYMAGQTQIDIRARGLPGVTLLG